jgi:hypothetical protein
MVRQVTTPSLTTFKLPLTWEGEQVVRKLQTDLEASDAASWRTLHAAMRLLWQDPLGEGPRGTYLLAFLTAASIDEGGSTMSEDRLVHWITALKYSARSFCAVEGWERFQAGEYKTFLE